MQTIYNLPAITAGFTKTQISTVAKVAVTEVLENGNVLEVAEAISGMEAFIKEVKSDKRFTDYVREETSKHNGKFQSSSGTKIELAETGTKYDYSNCNDADLIDLYNQQIALEEKIKSREAMLKALPLEGIDLAMQTTGEILKVYPPAKTSTSSYKITLAK